MQFVEGSEANTIEAVGILTAGEAILLKASKNFASVSLAARNEDSRAESTETSRENQHSGQDDKSAFAAVLDTLEQAIETAAVAVETMAGGVSSPQDLSEGDEGHAD